MSRECFTIALTRGIATAGWGSVEGSLPWIGAREGLSDPHFDLDGMTCRDGVSLRVVTAAPGIVRILVTILVMVSMPLCCCSFRSAGTCCSLGEIQHPAVADAAGDGCIDGDGHCHGGHGHCGTPADKKPGAPSHDGGDQCACGKSLKKIGVVDKPVVEIPSPALVAILPWPNTPSADLMPRQSALGSATQAPEPPPTSLLRQHCALTV